jgi:LacI family transcriptional regulator
VARLAGVSRTTVSFVLNDVPGVHITPETRQRVLNAAHALNYYPDVTGRYLASGKTQTIALVWHPGPDRAYRDTFLPGFLQGAARAAHHYGHHVIFRPIDAGEPEGSYVELARGHCTDGLILSGPRSDDPHPHRLRQDGFPLVLHGQLPGSDIPYVDVDNVRGAMTAVSHLLGLGHRRIAAITNAPLAYTASAHRLEGYRLALDEAGIPYDERLIRYGNFDEASGQRAMESLLALPEPLTAVFAASDTVALGALRALRRRGLHVPEDVALVGFDDITAARFITPALTTVHVPAFGLGWSAAELLIQIIGQDGTDHEPVLLDTELVIRETCGAPAELRTEERPDDGAIEP